MTEHPPLRSYGRTRARTLKPRQAGLVETLLPHLALPGEGAIVFEALFSGLPAASPARDRQGPLSDFSKASPEEAKGPVVLEIGFGGGEHLTAQAATLEAARFIGVEPFLNGVASCLRHIEEGGLANVRLHHGDARDVIARLPAASLDWVYILFPDPWPKKRHWKRRLIQSDFAASLAEVVKPGGEVRFATDWSHYAAWTLEVFTAAAHFEWMAKCAGDWRAPWPGHTPTRYEKKGLGDCAPVFLRFGRRSA